MGVAPNIAIDSYPKQGNWIDKRVEVCFNYDADRTIMGTFVRDDVEEPWVSIIRLDDGRYVLTTECQHRQPI